MEKLTLPKMPSAASPASRPSSVGRSMTTSAAPVNLPPVMVPYPDSIIPRWAWSSWREAGKPRQLRRPLEPVERTALERRQRELAPAVEPYRDSERDRVALALLEMYGSYPSMGSRGDPAAAGRVDCAARVLATFPAWAIERACQKIHMNGVWRDGAFDRKWPPSDSELVEAVRTEARVYTETYINVMALLEAAVEDETPAKHGEE
ncbi:MAG TPA: hypothetical protein VMQ76_06205 [Terracidiphilus sp.]|nr:hypothetical protein [Terracidiphilus sp.]